VSSNADCALKPAWSSSSEDLFQLAHDWSKTHDISHWEFSTQANNCSKVTYKTTISVPGVFSAFWKSHVIHMDVDKRLCVRGQSLRETLVIANMPFKNYCTFCESHWTSNEIIRVLMGRISNWNVWISFTEY
jgi:hypothetical protein